MTADNVFSGTDLKAISIYPSLRKYFYFFNLVLVASTINVTSAVLGKHFYCMSPINRWQLLLSTSQQQRKNNRSRK